MPLLLCTNLALLVTAIKLKSSNISSSFVAEMGVNGCNSHRSKLIKPHQNNYLVQPRKQRTACAHQLWRRHFGKHTCLQHFGSFLSQKHPKLNSINSPSRLSEQEVPIPVSPLSEAILCLLTGLLWLLDEMVVDCHGDSVPGNHPTEE